MTWLLGLPALLKRIPWQAYVIAAALLVAVLWHRAEVREAYRDGRVQAIAEIQARIARDKEAQRVREAAATVTLNRQRAADQGAAAARTKEIDNATRNLPDQGLTPRQRVRVCLELRAQGKAPPECGPVSSR